MLFPTIEKFKEFSKTYNRVPVYREIAGDIFTPISLLINFSHRKHLFLLESANLDRSFSRYSFFGVNPDRILKYQGGKLSIESGDRLTAVDENPVDYLMKELSRENSMAMPEFGNFCGGYVGFMGYDMVNHMGILRGAIREDSQGMSMVFFQVHEFYVFDNHRHKLYAVSSVPAGDFPEKSYEAAAARTMEMAGEIMKQSDHVPEAVQEKSLETDFNRESFMEAVKKLKKDITRGECIQTVLSNRYEIKGNINPLSLYRLMRNINPSPYMFYLKIDDQVLCGTSPETHLKITGRTAMLKPIAGTYKTEGKDIETLKKELLEDEKEVAEHLMLLDLARNDLYTGCEPDSVRVVGSFQPEVYSHVIHIVSEVEGHLKEGVSPLRLFCNTFPAGTVSGAPKVRAMELIDEYEPSPRGFYAGCAGYFSYSQDIDTCIIIRSALVKKDSVILRAGAGIVYDSDPEKEFLEVENKLGALFHSLKQLDTLEKKHVFAH